MLEGRARLVVTLGAVHVFGRTVRAGDPEVSVAGDSVDGGALLLEPVYERPPGGPLVVSEQHQGDGRGRRICRRHRAVQVAMDLGVSFELREDPEPGQSVMDRYDVATADGVAKVRIRTPPARRFCGRRREDCCCFALSPLSLDSE